MLFSAAVQNIDQINLETTIDKVAKNHNQWIQNLKLRLISSLIQSFKIKQNSDKLRGLIT